MSAAPQRDVVKVLDMDGPKGGRMLVLILSCGCFKTVRARTPPKSTPCVACFVKEQVAPSRDVLDELLDALALAGGIVTIKGKVLPRHEIRKQIASYVLAAFVAGQAQADYEAKLVAQGGCLASRDGECNWEGCPQNDPATRRSHCPRDTCTCDDNDGRDHDCPVHGERPA